MHHPLPFVLTSSTLFHALIIFATSSSIDSPMDNVAIFCSSSDTSTAFDGRVWVGDNTMSSSTSSLHLSGTSWTSTAQQKASLMIDTATALQMIQRLNVGGQSIPCIEDVSMFRDWKDEKSYLFGQVGAASIDTNTTVTIESAGLFDRKSAIATAFTVAITILNIAIYYLRCFSEADSTMRNTRSCSTDQDCRQFSLEEIQLSTNNFSPEFLIGNGGYGKVYRGSIDGGATTVAIKRLKEESRQGEKEFWTEIKMLSKFRNEHLVSLIGFCNEGKERVLVYEYMPRGTLADHLHKFDRSPFSWERRLKISIGAARGLHCLHTSQHKVIHRDVKSSNILLDECWEAKISDFGLSKMGPGNESFSHVTTDVKGTYGYLDPKYFLTHRLTMKSDVYAFGVVLLEVLTGRPALDKRLVEGHHNLATWAIDYIRKGKVNDIVDCSLAGQLSQTCLKVFVEIAERCLGRQPHERPDIADVITKLELVLALHQKEDVQNEVTSIDGHGALSEDNMVKTTTNRASKGKRKDILKGRVKKKDSNSKRKSVGWKDLLLRLAKTIVKDGGFPNTRNNPNTAIKDRSFCCSKGC